jgi:hypothetical protein
MELKSKWKIPILITFTISFAAMGLSCKGADTQADYNLNTHSMRTAGNHIILSSPDTIYNEEKSEVEIDITEKNIVTDKGRGADKDAETAEMMEEEKAHPEPVEAVEEYNEVVTLSGYEYHRVYDEKFSHLINIAESNGAHLYGIPYSDGFAIFSEEKGVMLTMSTGVAAAEISYAHLLIDYFSSDMWKEYNGIVDNIKHVVETGEEVKVDLGNFIEYGIKKENGRIVISWS